MSPPPYQNEEIMEGNSYHVSVWINGSTYKTQKMQPIPSVQCIESVYIGIWDVLSRHGLN